MASYCYYQERNECKNKLLAELDDLETAIDKHENDKLPEGEKFFLKDQVEKLRKQIEELLKVYDAEIEELKGELQDLKSKVQLLTNKNEDLTSENVTLTLIAGAQATQNWEAHVVRFVIPGKQPLIPTEMFDQIEDHQEAVGSKSPLWEKLQNIFEWSGERHWPMAKVLRKKRNYHAHPRHNLDLDDIEQKISALVRKQHQEPMKIMVGMLRMTASLMKFGRLATYYKKYKNQFPPLELRGKKEDALNLMASWNRSFEEIGGLQNVEHEKAKRCLATYEHDREMVDHCHSIVDFIKKENSVWLGKLAWEIEEHFCSRDKKKTQQRFLIEEEIKALNQLKKLLPKSESHNVNDLEKDIAKLHVPDFLHKDLWNHGIKVIDDFFNSD